MYLPALKADSDLALYMQLYVALRQDMLSNRLSSGTRLPSKRLLATGLGISINTVDTAYQQLVSEGYLEVRARSGYFVCDLGINISLMDRSVHFLDSRSTRNTHNTDAPIDSNMNSIIDYDLDFSTTSENAVKTVDFSPNGVDLDALPLAKIKKTIREIFDENGTRAFSNCDPQGAIELRYALCEYLKESRGLICDSSQIIIGAGTDYVLQLLVQILRSAKKMEAVAMENPVYNKAYQIFTGLQVPVELIPLDKSGVHMDSLRQSRSNLVYTTPSHQFPLGIIMPVSRRTELLAWASEANNRYIIEDDYDSEFRYAGRPIPAISGLDSGGRVIYSGTFSKSIAPSVRISYLVVPPELLTDFQSNLSYYNTTITHLDQLVLARFIKSGDFERHINRMRTLYRKKRDLFLKALSPYKQKLLITGTDAGLHLLCQVKNGMSEKELIESAKNAAAKVYGISSYYLFVKESASYSAHIPQSTVLLGYASLSDEQIEKGVTALASAWHL